MTEQTVQRTHEAQEIVDHLQRLGINLPVAAMGAKNTSDLRDALRSVVLDAPVQITQVIEVSRFDSDADLMYRTVTYTGEKTDGGYVNFNALPRYSPITLAQRIENAKEHLRDMQRLTTEAAKNLAELEASV